MYTIHISSKVLSKNRYVIRTPLHYACLLGKQIWISLLNKCLPVLVIWLKMFQMETLANNIGFIEIIMGLNGMAI